MENENKIENDTIVTEPVTTPEVHTEVPTEVRTEVQTEVKTEIPTEVQTTPVSNVAPTQNVVQPVVPTTQPVVNKTEPQVQIVMQDGNKDKKKKMDKQTIIRIVAASVIVLGLAVYFIFFRQTEKPTDEGDPKSVTTAYFNLLTGRNFHEAIKYVYLPENSYVSEDDYFTFISNNNKLKEIPGKGVKEVRKTSKLDTKAICEVTLSDDNVYTVNLDMQSDGNWKIILEDLYLKDWKVEVPGSSKLYIDGALVPKTLSKSNDKGHDVYTIPAIGPSKKTFKVETTFDELEKKLDVAGSNSGEEIKLELTKEDEINSALEGIKEMWNNMYKDYIDGATNDDVFEKYYDSNFKASDMDKVFKEYFDSLSGKGNKQYVYKDVEMESIIVNPDKKHMIEGNDVIRIEFGYKLNATVDYIYAGSKDVTKSMTRYSSIKLKKTEKGYLIDEITDDKLFNYLKYTIQEY